MSEDCNRHLESLRDAALHAANEGRYRDALELCDEAIDLAREQGDTVLVDRTVLNRSAVQISIGEGPTILATLRGILMRSTDPTNRFLAAQNIARIYEYERNWSRGQFYARLACEIAQGLGRQDWIAHSSNQLASHLLGDCYYEEAVQIYEDVLHALPEDEAKNRALVQGNLGYGKLMLHDHQAAFGHLFASLRAIRKLGLEGGEMIPRIYLCSAYLDLGRTRLARRHGDLALRIADEIEDPEWIKICLYLLGETCKQCGDKFLARAYFARLQAEYYPDQRDLSELLLAVDARSLVDLRA